jgi:hypothetical protein
MGANQQTEQTCISQVIALFDQVTGDQKVVIEIGSGHQQRQSKQAGPGNIRELTIHIHPQNGCPQPDDGPKKDMFGDSLYHKLKGKDSRLHAAVSTINPGFLKPKTTKM